MYHSTVGGETWYDKEFDKGTYRLTVGNWAFEKVNKVEYILQISQVQGDDKVTVDGELGKEVIQDLESTIGKD